MKTKAGILLGVVGVWLLSSIQPAPAADADLKTAPTLAGTWRWNFTMPDGSTTRPKLKLMVEDGQLSGATSFRPGSEAPITNIVVDGDQVSFQVIRQRAGEEIVTRYSGQWTDKSIKGKIESTWAGEKQIFNWNAERAHLGVEGVWRWTNSFFAGFGGGGGGRPPGGRGTGGRGRGFESRVELEQEGHKVTGKTVGRFGRSPSLVSNGSITNNEVYFEIERTFGETKFVTRYQGKQDGDLIKGTMEQEFDGEDRVIDWEAERVD
jgi:hypothetical protein